MYRRLEVLREKAGEGVSSRGNRFGQSLIFQLHWQRAAELWLNSMHLSNGLRTRISLTYSLIRSLEEEEEEEERGGERRSSMKE